MIRRCTLAAAALLAFAGPARADEVVAGVVVKTDAREIFVNLGAGRGVEDGARLRLKRPITLRHPITRRPVKDWLPIGDATVARAGTTMTMAVLDPALHAQVAIGDIVEIYVQKDDRVARTAEPPAPADDRPLPAVDADTTELLQLWRSLTGATLDRRISAWEGWLATHGSSPHAAAVADDLEALRAQREALSPRPSQGAAPVALAHAAPRHATAGRPLQLVFVVDADPATLASASLHYRARGATTYQRALLTREGGIYLRATIPAGSVNAPGLEYFVETVRPGGASGDAFASAGRPHEVEVGRPPLVNVFDAAPGRIRMSLQTTYLDFATFDHRKVDGRDVDRRDRFALAELDVLYRLRAPLWGVRAGFGSYRGVGGRAEGVWTEANPAPTVGFQYGYVEAELRTPGARVPLGAALRVIAGVGNDGFGVGGAVRLRIGDADRTNLSGSLSSIAELGFVSDLRLETWPDPRLPVGISVGVTDQPDQGDLGVRLATDLGWQARRWVRPTVRLSWQGRTAAHAGLGGGLGLVFDW
jgi:hypothetical protein